MSTNTSPKKMLDGADSARKYDPCRARTPQTAESPSALDQGGNAVGLQEEIDLRKKEIHTDGYPMSIGELSRLYEDGELDIHPEFQRFFRWSSLQKTKLIESILLGIPIPSIFVSQREDGVWDVVNGVQRLSTIFEFVGLLKDNDGKRMEPSRLLRTDYLPSLENKAWDNSENLNASLTQAQRIAFKREKLDLKIIKKESDKATKYELFQRLNTLGSSLTAQEVRNCLLIMLNRNFYTWLSGIAAYQPFLDAISLSDKQLDQRYDMELALRFFALKNATQEHVNAMKDLGEFITDRMKEFAEESGFDKDAEGRAFKATFDVIEHALDGDAFRRWDASKNRFLGGFLVAAFEATAVGVGTNLQEWVAPGLEEAHRDAKLTEQVHTLWSDPTFGRYCRAGVRGKDRAPVLVHLGQKLFKP